MPLCVELCPWAAVLPTHCLLLLTAARRCAESRRTRPLRLTPRPSLATEGARGYGRAWVAPQTLRAQLPCASVGAQQ